MKVHPYQQLSKKQWRKEKMELKIFCRGYYNMLCELKGMEEDLKPGSPCYDGMPKAQSNGSSVENKAIRLAVLQDRIDMIHLAAEQADFNMAGLIVEYVADGECSYDTLKQRGDISVSRAGFYQKIADFYRNLYQLRCEGAEGSGLYKRLRCGKARKDWAHGGKGRGC